mmetsp:Transcript_55640/g.153032  ORF Transcript_55640/g.153032 Transcript_55640/m.153032 type:complete len:415 (+) Transcript_55640:145-1389(+)
MASQIELNAAALTEAGEVFEGPEKKLEVFFTTGANPDGFRTFDQATWSELLVAASCSILHRQSNQHFDAYLLSESSLFVYPSRVILKTCGTTGLLLVLPKLLELAKSLDVAVEHVHYGHYRYKFPQMQAFPHASFDQEATYLSSTFGSVERRVLGPSDGRCWYALCSTQALPPCPSPPASPRDGDDLFEIAMEGLPAAVCAQFVGASHAPLEGRALAERMTAVSGIGALLPGVVIDDWAFEPCGYSMNGLRGGFYYTIHITPEEGFSYASFETNDPAYRQPKWVGAVVGVFQPSVLTVTLTTRRVQCDLPTYALAGFERNTVETASLAGGVTMCCLNFAAEVEGGCGSRKRKLAAGGSPIGCELSASLSFEADASASSAGSGSDGESASEVSSVIDESPGSPDVLPASGAVAAC